MKRMDRNFTAWGLKAATIACCLLLGPVAAIAAPPASVPMAQPTAKDDPAKVAAAKEFIILYHPRLDPKNIVPMIGRALPRRVAQAKRDNPKLDVKVFERDLRARMMNRATKALDLQAVTVSRHFTMQELQDLIAFFRGPLGQKLVVETPKIQKDMLMDHRREKAAMGGGGVTVKMDPTPEKSAPAAKAPAQKPK